MKREQLHELVDSLPDAQLPAAVAFLSELGDEVMVDPETAAKLDASLAEPGDNIPIEHLRRQLGL